MSLRSIDFPSYNPNSSVDLMSQALEHHSKRMAERRKRDVGLDLYDTYNSFIEKGKRPDFIREALRKAMLENEEGSLRNQYLEPGLQEALAKERLGNQGESLKNKEQYTRNQYLEPGLQELLSQSMLKTQSDRVEGQFKPEELRAKLANTVLQPDLTRAHINYYNKSREDTGLGVGITGQIRALERIKRDFGENSPQFQMAKRGVESEISLKEGRGDFFVTNLPLKNLSPATKAAVEEKYYQAQSERDANGLPKQSMQEWYLSIQRGNNNQTSMENGSQASNENHPQRNNNNVFADIADTVSAEKTKNLGLPQQMQQVEQMTNALGLLESFNPKDISKFAGLTGTAKKLYHKGNVAASNSRSSENQIAELERYDNAATTISDAIRSAFKTSVQPSMLDKIISQVENIHSPYTSPRIAERNFASLKSQLRDYALGELSIARGGARELNEQQRKSFENEMDQMIARKAGVQRKSVGIENQSRQELTNNIEDKKDIDGKRYIKINGEWYLQ